MAQLIIALNTPSISQAADWIIQTHEYCSVYKIGWQFVLHHGLKGLDFLYHRAKIRQIEFMLDLKFFDTPDTIGDIIEYMQHSDNIEMFTIAQLESTLVTATLDGLNKYRQIRPRKVIAVTQLTSTSPDNEILPDIDMMNPAYEANNLFPEVKIDIDGITCSGRRAQLLRGYLPRKIIISPGLRLDRGKSADNHADPVYLDEVKQFTAVDYWVCGRPIITADNPGEVARRIAYALN